MDPSPYQERYAISRSDVNDALDFIEDVAHAIHDSI